MFVDVDIGWKMDLRPIMWVVPMRVELTSDLNPLSYRNSATTMSLFTWRHICCYSQRHTNSATRAVGDDIRKWSVHSVISLLNKITLSSS